MSEAPTVTVLVPVRNEESDIERCLRAVLDQDHPHDRMEVVLVDGGSTDRTVELAIRMFGAGDIDWKIIDNPVGTTPSNLNAGLAVATGEILCRVDARSIVPPQYVRLCAEVLTSRPDVVVTGGAQVAVALGDSVVGVGIVRALNNRYAMGGARYRSGASSGPSDTVYLGAFRTSLVRAAGGWDEFFETNQDYELNRRMGRGGTVWFDDRLEVGYLPRRSIPALWIQYHRFGRWKARYWRHTGDRPQRRQAVALIGLGSATVGLVSIAIGLRHRRGWPVAVLLLSGAGLLAMEELGSDAEPASPGVRVIAAASIVASSYGWASGVLRGSVFDRSRAP